MLGGGEIPSHDCLGKYLWGPPPLAFKTEGEEFDNVGGFSLDL